MTPCIFCRIASGEIPASIVLETPDILAFRDLSPQAPQHILVVPRKHIARLSEVTAEDRDLLGSLLLAARQVARELHFPTGFRTVINDGESAGQSVFHLHLHLLGGRDFTWPPG
jgi:histidine triad (HIT) family protein